MESAASCNPAIQPSVRSSSVVMSLAERSSSITPLKNAAASSKEKASSAAPSSAIWPLARRREIGRGGSTRLEMTKCVLGGRRSSRKDTIPWTASESIRW
jgi:hypothetical protein